MSVPIAVLLLLSASPAGLQTSTTAPAAAPTPAAKPICRREDTTGSIMPGKRVCHTAAEWKQIDGEHENSVDNFRNRPGARSGTLGGSD